MMLLQKVLLSTETYELIARKMRELQQENILSYDLAESFKDVLAKIAALEYQLVIAAEVLHNKPGAVRKDSSDSWQKTE